MDNQNPQNTSAEFPFIKTVEEVQAKNFMANVFAYMFMALGISALFAYLFGSNPHCMQYLVNPVRTPI